MKKQDLPRVLALVVVVASSLGCGKSSLPNFEMLPSLSMMDQKSLKAFKAEPHFANGAAMQQAPEGTLARNEYPYHYQKTDAAAEVGKNLQNSVPRNKETLARGQQMYSTHCIVCHGAKGKGDGNIIPKFPMPPSLQSDKIRGYPDGAIYHVITAGQNIMPSYASQIDVADRWAIVHYIRALQASVNP